MDEEIERLVIAVRADTQRFAGDVAAMRAKIHGPFANGLDRAGRTLEKSLARLTRRPAGYRYQPARRLWPVTGPYLHPHPLNAVFL